MNIFSFCIYGTQKRYYYDGLLKNIKIINDNYPNYYIYIYVGTPYLEEYINIWIFGRTRKFLCLMV